MLYPLSRMKHDNAQATKADLARVDGKVDSLRAEMVGWKDEVKRHFDVVVEQLRHDLLGANRDRIELLTDKTTHHERPLRRLEALAGVMD